MTTRPGSSLEFSHILSVQSTQVSIPLKDCSDLQSCFVLGACSLPLLCFCLVGLCFPFLLRLPWSAIGDRPGPATQPLRSEPSMCSTLCREKLPVPRGEMRYLSIWAILRCFSFHQCSSDRISKTVAVSPCPSLSLRAFIGSHGWGQKGWRMVWSSEYILTSNYRAFWRALTYKLYLHYGNGPCAL